MRAGGVVFDRLDAFGADADSLREVPELRRFGENLDAAIGTARTATEHLVERVTTDPNAVLSASTPYLRLLGTVVCAGLLARSALAATAAATDGGDAEDRVPAGEGGVGAILRRADPADGDGPARRDHRRLRRPVRHHPRPPLTRARIRTERARRRVCTTFEQVRLARRHRLRVRARQRCARYRTDRNRPGTDREVAAEMTSGKLIRGVSTLTHRE